MEAYRDQYARLFNGGDDVTLIGISTDPVDELASWAADADFPFLFGSDPGSSVYAAFGGDPRSNGMVGSRAVIVVDPEGRVSEVIPAFNQVDPSAYDRLEQAVDEAAGG